VLRKYRARNHETYLIYGKSPHIVDFWWDHDDWRGIDYV